MIGQHVGRFRIIAKLGEGGMGAVWEAEDTLLGRTVAIKVMRDRLERTGAEYDQFLREARATAVLQHPGIATLYDAGEHDGRPFIAIARIEGETVSNRLTREPLPLSEAVRIAAEAADALEFAHVHGVLHRDVTSRNLMLARDGRVVLIDFGLARDSRVTPSSTSGFPAGTVHYMAPEVMRGQRAHPGSDVYGLGVVLYEMVTGVLPYQGALAPAIVYAAMNRRPELPHRIRSDVSSALERVMLRAIARDPERRYRSAAHLAQRLRAVTLDAGSSVVNRPRRASPRTRRGNSSVLTRRVLAIAPFTTLDSGTTQPVDASLAGGLAESLAASLAAVPRLQLVPPMTIQSQLGTSRDAVAAARELGAHALLLGTLSRGDDTLRANLTLLDVRHGRQLGGDRVDGSLADLLAFEDALHTSLLRMLRIATAPRRPRAVHADPAAHEQFLRALGYLQRIDDETSVDHAIANLEALVVAEGDTARVHATLGRAYDRKYRVTHDDAWRRRAEESCRKALALDPHAPETLLTLSWVLLSSGRNDEVIASMERALALRADDADALLQLSKALETVGRIDEAEQAAERLIRAQPNSLRGHDQLAAVRFRSGRYADAAEAWKRTTELAPDHAVAYGNLAAAYYHLGRLVDARVAFERAEAIRPRATTTFGLATLLFYMGERTRAVELFERGITLEPKDPRAWGNLADAQRWTPGLEQASADSFDRAIDLAKRELRQNPNDPDGWSRLGKWLAKRGRIAEAIEALGRSLDLAPRNTNCIARAITIHHLAGNGARAVEAFLRAWQEGYSRVELERDPELESLRQVPEIARLLASADPRGNTSARTITQEAEHGTEEG
jgi:serine/threonine protein kinase/tetratricopeptide (TPR) repeat protein